MSGSEERPVLGILDRLGAASVKPRRWKGCTVYRVRCPYHNDRTPSLDVIEHPDGEVRFKCHAGCPYESVMAALSLSAQDLLPASRRWGTKGRPIVAVYEYFDEDGVLLYERVRFANPKGFRFRSPDGTWSIEGVRRVPYRLPQLIEDIALGRRIFFTEGEKDTDTLVRAGLSATTTGGTDSWRPDFVPIFQDAEVAILPDNDRAGREHAARVAVNLLPVARSVRVVMLPDLPPRGDVSDWMEAGGTADALDDHVAETPLWHPGQRIRPITKTTQAIGLLRSELAAGPQPSRAVLAHAQMAGISERTLRTAMAQLGVRADAVRTGDGTVQHWLLSLPARAA